MSHLRAASSFTPLIILLGILICSRLATLPHL
jgi:hypothetical protein